MMHSSILKPFKYLAYTVMLAAVLGCGENQSSEGDGTLLPLTGASGTPGVAMLASSGGDTNANAYMAAQQITAARDEYLRLSYVNHCKQGARGFSPCGGGVVADLDIYRWTKDDCDRYFLNWIHCILNSYRPFSATYRVSYKGQSYSVDAYAMAYYNDSIAELASVYSANNSCNPTTPPSPQPLTAQVNGANYGNGATLPPMNVWIQSDPAQIKNGVMKIFFTTEKKLLFWVVGGGTTIRENGASWTKSGSGGIYEVTIVYEPKTVGSQAATLQVADNNGGQIIMQLHVLANAQTPVLEVNIGTPIYYNRCENYEDIKNPLIGANTSYFSEYIGTMGSQNRFAEHTFGNGYFVGEDSKSKGAVVYARIIPFQSKQAYGIDLSRGTCTFWASATGGIRTKGDDTLICSYLTFTFTDKIQFLLYAPGRGGNYYRLTVPEGNTFTAVMSPGQLYNFTLQWDAMTGFDDGTNLRLYCDGVPVFSTMTALTTEAINQSVQNFLLHSSTTNGGDYRTRGHASIDTVIFWNTIVDPQAIMAAVKK